MTDATTKPLLDLVNEKDEVIGTTTKEESHDQGLWHRIVAIHIFRSDGQLFVTQRQGNGKFDHSVGGHVDAGESYETAARREGQEEIQLDPKTPLRFHGVLAKIYPTSLGGMVRHQVGVFSASTDQTFVPDQQEIRTVRLMTRADLARELRERPHDFTHSFRSAVRLIEKDIPRRP